MQLMLDNEYGVGKYSVTNLGACGSTMLKGGDSPFWKRPQYTALVNGKWDIVTIMLGTNDAKDSGSHGPNNWHHDCGGPTATKLEGCAFADSYKDMITLLRTLGTTPAGPNIYVMIPPPLMQHDAYGMNQTVINSVYPKLIPLIQKANNVNGPIDIYASMGGTPDWEEQFPAKCELSSPFEPCGSWCDQQHCDQCHPNDNGYVVLAQSVLKGLGFGVDELLV
jgi:lysophospholipase L1-like esterase